MSVQTEDPKGQEALGQRGLLGMPLVRRWVTGSLGHSYLSVVGHGAEELQLQVKSSRVFVEEPPQTAGQVLRERGTQQPIR